MTEILKGLTCCGAPVNGDDNADNNGTIGYGIWCEVCNARAWGSDKPGAIASFKKMQPPQNSPQARKTQNNSAPPPAVSQAVTSPRNPGELALMIQGDTRLVEIMTPIVSGDTSAMKRLISNNLRYVENADQLKKAWMNPEGQASIVRCVEEAMIMGAELGKMGDLVPYGDIVEFIPSVEAYEFALTNGKNAPFESIEIELIHANDVAKISRKDGDFSMDLQIGIPRGEVQVVAVYGYHSKSGKVVGEVYDKDRLMKKAEDHSASYRKYLQQVSAFEFAKSEGKANIDSNGREYVTIEIQKESEDKYFAKDKAYFFAEERAGRLIKDSKGEYATQRIEHGRNGPWDKKIYRSAIENPGVETKLIFLDELTNPYAGADQPEMLRKAAGKSFMRKYQRIRNSEAAMDEVRTHDKTVDTALNMADDILDV